eukprot:m.299594 g.299594  ORF g.299594 m.299594 type:complete len:313 (-) comp19548_c3_seq8:106-1044(-)
MPDRGKKTRRGMMCGCGRWFSSGQALGGHRSKCKIDERTSAKRLAAKKRANQAAFAAEGQPPALMQAVNFKSTDDAHPGSGVASTAAEAAEMVAAAAPVSPAAAAPVPSPTLAPATGVKRLSSGASDGLSRRSSADDIPKPPKKRRPLPVASPTPPAPALVTDKRKGIQCTCGRWFANGQALGGHRGKCKVPRVRQKDAERAVGYLPLEPLDVPLLLRVPLRPFRRDDYELGFDEPCPQVPQCIVGSLGVTMTLPSQVKTAHFAAARARIPALEKSGEIAVDNAMRDCSFDPRTETPFLRSIHGSFYRSASS